MEYNEVKALTDEELRIKVAELCGITVYPQHAWEDKDNRRYCECYRCGATHVYPYVNTRSVGPCVEANYPQDLNAMNEAEKYPALQNTNGTRMLFIRYLSRLTSGDCIFAPARSRAEAFVLALTEDSNEV